MYGQHQFFEFAPKQFSVLMNQLITRRGGAIEQCTVEAIGREELILPSILEAEPAEMPSRRCRQDN